MSPKYRTKEFQDLKAKWYRKLVKIGFKDVEQDEDHMKQWDSHVFVSRHSAGLYNSKEKYYQLAGQFFYDNKFRSKKEKFVWELHSIGYTVRAIAAEMKSKNYKICSRPSVHTLIVKLEKEMLEKYANEDD